MFCLEPFRALNAADVRHVLVGGVALNLHGVERATMDFDVAIAVDDANLRRCRCLRRSGARDAEEDARRAPMRKLDFTYTISEERLRAYAAVPDIERLRWLDELVRFTLMWRAAAPGCANAQPGLRGIDAPAGIPGA
jgi:hypothetical protein